MRPLADVVLVHARLSDVAPVRAKGFDHTVQGSYAAAATAAKALRLPIDQIANAIAISGTGPVLEGTARSTANGGSTTTASPYATSSSTSVVGLGALTLASNSTLDFGASTQGTMVFTSFADPSNAFTLNIISIT